MLRGERAGRERPLASVPRPVAVFAALALAAQVAWQWPRGDAAPQASDLPPPPATGVLALASLGERAAFARVAMLWLQAFDSSGTNATPYRSLDYDRLVGWLEAIQAVDPRSAYPLFAGSRIYAEVADPARVRRMLAFVHGAFLDDPNGRWPALAQAALIAKHRLRDLPLALRYAADLQRLTTDPTIPSWARQMEIFILEDMNELEAARIMLGGLLVTGRIRDPEERRFLEGRLKEIERRLPSHPGSANR